jgi:hypothetical protein
MPTKKEMARLAAKEEPVSPLTLDPGFRDESDKYDGKLREAMKKYGSFKGHFRSKK